MSVEGLRALLEGHGYEVRFREDEWVECLLLFESETWLGRGADREAALSDAVSAACPSALARSLLEQALSPPVDRPEPRASSGNGARRSQPPMLVPKTAPLPPDLDRSLEALTTLEQRIRDTRDELGLCSAERQRLAIFSFICEARGHTDVFPDDARIRDGVAVISRLLTEIGKSFWPGSVTALQLHMQPRDLPRHLLGGIATTWVRAAELAERALTSLEYADERRGYDVYGWADPTDVRPLPLEPGQHLDALYAEIEAMSGSLERQAEPKAAFRPKPEQYLRWIRTLRWLRCSGASPERWARVAGRLRWWAGRRDPNLVAAARELDSAHAPNITWLAALEEAEVETCDDSTLPAELLDRVRGAYTGKRLVFVSQRRDPDLQASLTDALSGASLEWRVAEPKRLHDLGDSITNGDFDVVLAALGFSSQGADHLLARACREAGVGYVRVNRGRPIVCLRALARGL